MHKLKDFVLEILIIVFAVSLSLWLHNISEHRTEQKQVKLFLTGLRDDLKLDTAEMNDVLDTYKNSYAPLYTYLSQLSEKKIPNKDTFHAVIKGIGWNLTAAIHQTRFNGFLASGKMTNIEDEDLALQILNYYQEIIPNCKRSENGWISENGRLNTFLFDNIKDFDNDMDYWKVLASSKARHLSKTLIPWPQLLERYQAVYDEATAIIVKINKLYPQKK
ncbi:MAG: hypothetical protein LBE82_07890 [Chitinophagaceae bacterium]|nr:hypothetical protein [Chitinophagaceae bacterium]